MLGLGKGMSYKDQISKEQKQKVYTQQQTGRERYPYVCVFPATSDYANANETRRNIFSKESSI